MDTVDQRIAVELAVARHLLLELNVCGHNKTGAGLEITLSSGAPKKLLKEESDKEHLVPYASFLRTRLVGARIVEVEHSSKWFDAIPITRELEMTIEGRPRLESLKLNGVGDLEITGHAMDMFIERTGVSPVKAWLRLTDVLQKAVEVHVPKIARSAALNHRAKNVRVFWTTDRRPIAKAENDVAAPLVMIVAENQPPYGTRRLITCYPVDDMIRRELLTAPGTSRSGRPASVELAA
jgi:hypothetical protein